MKNFFSALILGAILGGAAVAWFSRSPAPPRVAIDTPQGPPNNIRPSAGEVQATSPASTPARAMLPPSPGTKSTPVATEAVPPKNVEPHAYRLPVTDEVRKILDTNRSAAVPRSTDLRYVDPASLHDRLELEPQDAWSTTAEHDLRQFFAARAPELYLNAVVCGQTICEVQASGPGPASMEVIMRVESEMQKQGWGQQLQPRIAVTGEHDYLLQLERAIPK